MPFLLCKHGLTAVGVIEGSFNRVSHNQYSSKIKVRLDIHVQNCQKVDVPR